MSQTNSTTNQIVEQIFAGLDARQRKVLTKRYGLDTGEEQTLAELGKSFNVTRERIRQIEASAIAEVRRHISKSNLSSLVAAAKLELAKTGGVRREDHLLSDLKQFADGGKELPLNFASQVRFLLEISGEVLYHRDDEELSSHWHLSESHQQKAIEFLDQLVKHIRDRKNETLDKKQFEAFFHEVRELHKLEEQVARHYVHISKKFGSNLYGDFGLTEWSEVSPKVSRDWIYLILKKATKPLHFDEIAGEIRRLRPRKKTNTQTIHNELIKDKRFLLVGRGIYSLRDHDALPAGTIRDILLHILKSEGPMKPKDLIGKVLKHRIFKETTILFNLQNKKFFKRLPTGEYQAIV